VRERLTRAAGSRRGATLAGGPALARERVSRVRRERAAVLGLASVAGRAVERCWAGRKSQLGRAGRALGQRSEGLGRLLVFWAGFSFLFLFYLSFLFLIQTKFEFKYEFEFKPHSNKSMHQHECNNKNLNL